MRSGGASSSGAPLANNEASLPKLELTDIGRDFGSFTALDGIDIAFRTGEVHCLLGENGAGKSTLCNLIFGVHQPTRGFMTLNGAPYAPNGPHAALAQKVAMVHQHFSLIDELTTVDNLLLGRKFGLVDRKAEAAKILALAEEFGLDIKPHAVVGDLSVGQRQRIEIVKCLMQRPEVLILDEPTAVLLPDEIEALLKVCADVAARGSAVVLVTHKLAEIRKIADEVSVLRAGRIVARSTRPAEDMNDLTTAMIGRSGTGGAFGVASLPPRAPHARSRMVREALQIDGLSFFDQTGARRLDKVTLTVDQGEIIGLAGVEGNGQSELGSILAGLDHPSEGRWFVGGKELTHAKPRAITAAGAGIIPEDRHKVGAVNAMTLADNLYLNQTKSLTRWGLIDRKRQTEGATSLMKQFDVRAQGPAAPFSSLSGGNQQKAVLARELMTPNLRFLLAMNPTRGLDIGAIEAVYRSIREAADKGIGVLLISSELDELLAVADRISVIYRGSIVGTRMASYDNRAAIGSLMSGTATQ
ncbi:ABC transporter ATP-binding protein [Rhodobacterales bacterium]|nr:ABC transporter ATP-binding protein [Rhodobacterales bacterium]